MRTINLVLALAALILAPDATQAQTPVSPSNAQPEWSDVPEIVVRAPTGGPAMWKLTKGGSVVWVLPLLTVRPETMQWESGRFRRILKGANVLIFPYLRTWELPPERVLLLPGRLDLQDAVGSRTYRRFQDRVETEGFVIDTYTGFKPIWAGVILTSDTFYKRHMWDDLIPASIPAMAKEYGVPTKPVERQTAQSMLKLYADLDSKGSESCLVNYLDSLDYDIDVMPRVAASWAAGDVKATLRDYQEPGLMRCLLADPKTAADYKAYAIDDMVTAIDDAFTTPGKSVAIVPLSDLLRKDGVLDRVRAQGVTITSPTD